MSAWTNAYWPRSGERGSTSWRTSSRRTSGAQTVLDRSPVSIPETAASPSRCEALAEHRCVLDAATRSDGLEAVEAGRDESTESLRERRARRGRRTGSNVPSSRSTSRPSATQHPDRLDGVERDAVGTPDDRRRPLDFGRPGTSPTSRSRIAGAEQRVDIEGEEVRVVPRPSRGAARGAPGAPG